jgi:hypothetical protein
LRIFFYIVCICWYLKLGPHQFIIQ